jgi:hypothetical protein
MEFENFRQAIELDPNYAAQTCTSQIVSDASACAVKLTGVNRSGLSVWKAAPVRLTVTYRSFQTTTRTISNDCANKSVRVTLTKA